MNRQSQDFFARNSELSIEFSKLVLDHPEMDELLSEEAAVVFLPDFDPDLREFNLRMGKEIENDTLRKGKADGAGDAFEAIRSGVSSVRLGACPRMPIFRWL